MCENAGKHSSRSWSAGCGESYLSGAGSAGRNSTAERQHGRRPSTPFFRLKHYWRFVDSEALDLKALSWGVDEKAA